MKIGHSITYIEFTAVTAANMPFEFGLPTAEAKAYVGSIFRLVDSHFCCFGVQG